jgi:nitroreductase
MDLLEAIRTTRAMRRLDPDRPVAQSDLRIILDAARMGPSGGNRQPCRWIVVRDSGLREVIGKVYRRRMLPILLSYRERAESLHHEAALRDIRSSLHLAEHMHDAPVIIVGAAREGRRLYQSSLYPSAQNLMLAARSLGLGTTLTSTHLDPTDEKELKALLEIPADVDVLCLIPVGHPLGRWGEAKRRPLEQVVYHDRWGADGAI